MNEDFLQHIWRYQLFDASELSLESGERLRILNPGQINRTSGPDFQNARILIDKTEWFGSIEIHKKYMDWYRHGHHTDQRYNNVILHVVHQDRIDASDPLVRRIPHLNLKGSIPLKYQSNYQKFSAKKRKYPCFEHLEDIHDLSRKMWLNRMSIERLEVQVKRIQALLAFFKGDWDQTALVFAGRYFGMRQNNSNFEALLMKIPYRILAKKSDRKRTVESILYGLGGLLPKESEDLYVANLIEEFKYQSRLYGFVPLIGLDWKYMRVRPANFPDIRISQLAHFIQKCPSIMTSILNFKSIKEIGEKLNIFASQYWNQHSRFHVETKMDKQKKAGAFFIQNLIINGIIPLLFSYGKIKNDRVQTEKALNLLDMLLPEKNHIVTLWQRQGLKTCSAAETQGLIHATKNYCEPKNCLNCTIGHHIIKGKSKRS